MNMATKTTPQSAKTRIEYIDILKGLAILTVLWSHTIHTYFGNWNPGTFGNIAFFFLSGFFFKVIDIKTFIEKKGLKILLPFIVFYILSYPIRLGFEYWDYRDLNALNYEMIWDIFKIEGRHDYLYANVPLWFLLAIFFVQLIGLFIFRLPKWIVFIFAIIVIFLREILFNIPTPFMINNSIHWFGFFALGYLFGKPTMSYLSTPVGKRNILLGSVITLAISIICITNDHIDQNNMVIWLQYLALTLCLLVIASYFENISATRFLKYLGANTLLLLCTSEWFLIPMTRVINKMGLSYWPIGILLALICTIIMIPLINFINKRLPLLAGK